MSEEKNSKIKDTLRATKERRSQMDCRVFSFKVQENRLSRAKEEKLNRCFLEAKWLRNAVVATDSLSLEDTSNVQVKVNGSFETREIKCLSSQMKQSVVDGVKQDVYNLSKAKKKGLKVGRLQFKKECSEINLKQFGHTYSIKGKNKIRIEKIGVLTVNGLEQINLDEVEFANAKLIQKPSGFYIHITTYSKKQFQPQSSPEKEILGLDMGIKEQLTFSNGVKVNFYMEESEQLKGLMRKLSRQHKGSNQYKQTLNRIKRIYEHLNNKKNDVVNKLNSVLKQNYIICFQDELLNSWKRKKSKQKFSFGKQVQHGILGRVKDKLNKLKKNNSNYMLESSVPTTQTCPECGWLTKHSLDKRIYHCSHCGYENQDRDIHSAKNMILLSGYGTYRSLNTDTVSTERMISLLTNLSNLGVVVTTNSMEAHCL
jgi:putative transposase